MIQHPASHVDHALTPAQLRYLLEHFAERRAFFLETIELPEALGTVPCGLHGPIMGDPPIAETAVTYHPRGDRAWPSRLVDRSARTTRQITVIAGPHEEPCEPCNATGSTFSLSRADSGHGDGHTTCSRCHGAGKLAHACILYTAFGGPAAPQEPGDPGCKDPATSTAFWREHALSK